jgi:serine/tyrosine/threonine adenylyltransferase
LKKLRPENPDPDLSAPREGSTPAYALPRQVENVHYSLVIHEPVDKPYFVAASESCARSLGIEPTELSSPKFVAAFSGNLLLPGLDKPYGTVYGCHCYGHWFGQLGDGRAISMGEVKVEVEEKQTEALTTSYYSDSLFELQLKGSGRSPFSRGFDGRAVLRSSIREFLVSEAMHHLNVPTTRALSLIGTGQEIKRAWYDATATDRKNAMQTPQTQQKTKKFTPNVLLREPGAILCRVSKRYGLLL